MIEPIHLLLGLLPGGDRGLQGALRVAGVDPQALHEGLERLAEDLRQQQRRLPRRFRFLAPRIGITVDAEDLCRRARKSWTLRGAPGTEALEILLAILDRPFDGLVEAVRSLGSSPGEIRAAAEIQFVLPPALPGSAPDPAESRPPLPAACALGRDLTALARKGELGPVVGREQELRQLCRILLRHSKSNPILIGPPGVGKTAVVEGLAIVAGLARGPRELARLRIIAVPSSALVAGTSLRGELEQKVQELVAELAQDPQAFVLFEDIHLLVGAGRSAEGGQTLSHLIKPAMLDGRLRVIGTTTDRGYHRMVEHDPSLARCLQPVEVAEPSADQARRMLEAIRGVHERHHEVSITGEAASRSVEASMRYLPDRRLPDKAVDLLDQACAEVRLRALALDPPAAAPPVTAADVDAVISAWTGIPAGRLSRDDVVSLVGLRARLARRVVGQDEAVAEVAAVVQASRVGLGRPRRPIGVFLFLGPTGVGKTELARALAEELFGDRQRLVRIDMSEHQDQYTASRLIGAPPGYIDSELGGMLTEAVRSSPYSVVLFDEIEKAHPSIANLFLQIFDDGRLTDARGNVVCFRHTVLIMTSNLGVRWGADRRSLGFSTADSDGLAVAAVDPDQAERALAGHFRPELLNRIDRVVLFRPLARPSIERILDKTLADVRARLAPRRVSLVVRPAARERLIDEGYAPDRGARELERVVERRVVHPLANLLVLGRLADGEAVELDWGERGYRYLCLSKQAGRVARPTPVVSPARVGG